MAARKRGLGRGLDALLSAAKVRPEPTESSTEQPLTDQDYQAVSNGEDQQLRQLPIEYLQPGRYQPRRDMNPEALEDLAASVKVQGIIQPIVARQIDKSGKQFEIIAGERRWRAAQLAELELVPVIIRQVEDEAAIAMALIENIQREDLNAMEEARALQQLADEFQLTHQEIAEAVGKSRTGVTNYLRLNQLNDDVQKLLEYGDLEMGHAKALLGLSGNQQSEVAQQVVAKGMNVRETEDLVRRNQQPEQKPTTKSIDPNINELQQRLTDRLGAKVAVQHSAKGKGKLVIHYSDLDQLDGILAHIEK
ncbi:ParB/RepB/Spo0J family partition protein [Pelagibaculum spongiae]|uniref:Probable chromosome-partitioning protein ParB n=1 Tax=Pelagibaculum spongiae TaxID=2080658 RepID=A0A2V1H011_9GAMM|nr:ParB/RepB/Spo0J family partition protein [Pelagibaculum spongiae]PVZ67709.1 chromosome partitioning protein ParB [Pelagibaculum spongiae]